MNKKIELAILKKFKDSFYINNYRVIKLNCCLLYKYLCLNFENNNKKIYEECLKIMISESKSDFLNQIYYAILINSGLVSIKKDSLYVDTSFSKENFTL